MIIHSLSYQEKQALIRHLAKLYSRQSVILHSANIQNQRPFSEEYEDASYYVGFIDAILERLTKEHKEILVNDFFHQKERNWWTKYYSKTTYYRIKSTAMNEFLHCL